MKLTKATAGLSASIMALSAFTAPLAAQEEGQNPEDANRVCHDNAGEIIACGTVGALSAYALSEMAQTSVEAVGEGRNNMARKAAVKNADNAVARAARTGSNLDTAYPMLKDSQAVVRDPASPQGRAARIADNAEIKTLTQRGEVAQRARANAMAGTADDVAKLDARGKLAQQIRANKAVVPSGTSPLASPEAMGNRAQAARTNIIGGSADDLARLEANGARAQNSRFNRVGSSANLDQLDRQGRFAQDARGRGVGNTSNLDLEARGNAARTTRFQARNVNAAARGGPSFDRALQGRAGPDDIARLTGQADAAQAARGRIVNEGQLARRINARGGDVGRLNQAGRSAQAARGVSVPNAAPKPAAGVPKPAGKMGKLTKFGGNVAKGAVVGIAATESVKALTGAEMDDPLSTGFRYGSAIFDKDVTMGDVARDRWEHHKSNFKKIGETLTTKGKLKENMQTYGAEKREKIGNATGMELHAMRDTNKRYAEAIANDGLKGAGQVAGERAKHHLDNTKKVTKKVGCGLGNIFRKKENDKDC